MACVIELLSTWVVGRLRKSVRVDWHATWLSIPSWKKCYYYLSIRHSEIWMICVIIV
jgi:hypothetical protein